MHLVLRLVAVTGLLTGTAAALYLQVNAKAAPQEAFQSAFQGQHGAGARVAAIMLAVSAVVVALGLLVEIGRQLARDPAIRAEINRGMVRVLADFVQSQKSGVGRFIADQVKSWDIDMLIGGIELTVGRDLQYIRFNGAMIGGLAGLALHALEQGLKLAL